MSRRFRRWSTTDRTKPALRPIRTQLSSNSALRRRRVPFASNVSRQGNEQLVQFGFNGAPQLDIIVVEFCARMVTLAHWKFWLLDAFTNTSLNTTDP